MVQQNPIVLTVTGPTGSGKSKLAMHLAEALGGEIINADSVQMYRDFCIGASQPSPEDCLRLPHHLYQVLDPRHRSDVATFSELAAKKIEEVRQRNALPVVVGGSGMYVRVLYHGLADVPEIPLSILQVVRDELEALRVEPLGRVPSDQEHSEQEPSDQEHSEQRQGDQEQYWERVRSWLLQQDSRAAQELHPSDTQRILRAVAVMRFTGQSLFHFQDCHAQSSQRFRGVVLYLEPPRDELYARIDQRVDAMWESGLEQEVVRLREKYGSQVHAMGSIGYRHVQAYLNAEWSREKAQELMKRDTRRFAKRQMTWWRNQPAKLGWYQCENSVSSADVEEIIGTIKELSISSGEECKQIQLLKLF